jgi:hypothetical protein
MFQHVACTSIFCVRIIKKTVYSLIKILRTKKAYIMCRNQEPLLGFATSFHFALYRLKQELIDESTL